MRSFRLESWRSPRLNVFSGGVGVQCCAPRNGGTALDALAGHHGHPRAAPPSTEGFSHLAA